MFSGDGGSVRGHWYSYTERIDLMMEEALRLNVKWSMQEIARAINGDGRSFPNPLFKVMVVLNSQVRLNNMYMYMYM